MLNSETKFFFVQITLAFHWECIHGIQIVALMTEPLYLLISTMLVVCLVQVSTYAHSFCHIHVHIQSLVQKMGQRAQFCRTGKYYFWCGNLRFSVTVSCFEMMLKFSFFVFHSEVHYHQKYLKVFDDDRILVHLQLCIREVTSSNDL